MLFCTLFDLGMALIFVLFGLWFYRRGEQACHYLTGYTALSDAQRAKLDLPAMGRAYGARMLWMAVPFLAGAAIDCFVPELGCALAWGVWIVLFAALLRLRIRLERHDEKA